MVYGRIDLRSCERESVSKRDLNPVLAMIKPKTNLL
jgi:hypothetical protein